MHDTRHEAVVIRPPEILMTPERLGALQPNRLSASRLLMTKMIRERWSITLAELEIDEHAAGTGRYVIDAGGSRFEFVVFSSRPSLEGRTDRIIGQHWDMMGALLEGTVDEARLARTREELPKLYGGRAADGTLIWCRANRSMRLFDLAIEELAAGRQPPVDVLGTVCYLMRNIGLDGNGTFGTRSFLDFEPDHPLAAPLAAQMLASYLMREFSFDLVERLAAARSPQAVALDPAIKRFLGLGNGSGLGLLFFSKAHPVLLDRWLTLRETALARATGLEIAAGDVRARQLDGLLDRAITHKLEDTTRHERAPTGPEVAEQLRIVRSELAAVLADESRSVRPLAALRERAATLVDAETQEVLHALLLELLPDDSDAVAAQLIVDEDSHADPSASVGELLTRIHADYDWVRGFDLDAPSARSIGWYKSEDAEEPRRGPLADLPDGFDDLTLDLVAWIPALVADLEAFDPAATVGAFLREQPQHRALVERIQTLADLPFHTPRINWRDEQLFAAHLIRMANSAIHGLDKTAHPEPNGVIGVLFHGAPIRQDLVAGANPDWTYPTRPEIDA